MSDLAKLFPCSGCGKPWSHFDPKEWSIDPCMCKECMPAYIEMISAALVEYDLKKKESEACSE